MRNSLGPELNEGACKVTDYFAGERKSPSFDDVFGKSTEVEQLAKVQALGTPWMAVPGSLSCPTCTEGKWRHREALLLIQTKKDQKPLDMH